MKGGRQVHRREDGRRRVGEAVEAGLCRQRGGLDGEQEEVEVAGVTRPRTRVRLWELWERTLTSFR